MSKAMNKRLGDLERAGSGGRWLYTPGVADIGEESPAPDELWARHMAERPHLMAVAVRWRGLNDEAVDAFLAAMPEAYRLRWGVAR